MPLLRITLFFVFISLSLGDLISFSCCTHRIVGFHIREPSPNPLNIIHSFFFTFPVLATVLGASTVFLVLLVVQK